MPPSARALHARPKTIAAACYNRVRLSLARRGRPLRVPLPGHRGLEMILDDRWWLCVDGLNDDQPILAWHEFETVERSALHAPVQCRMCIYHFQAGLIMGSVLDALEQALAGADRAN
jgi:hypothetical protein